MFHTCAMIMLHLLATNSIWPWYTILDIENDTVDISLETVQCVLTTDMKLIQNSFD